MCRRRPERIRGYVYVAPLFPDTWNFIINRNLSHSAQHWSPSAGQHWLICSVNCADQAMDVNADREIDYQEFRSFLVKKAGLAYNLQSHHEGNEDDRLANSTL